MSDKLSTTRILTSSCGTACIEVEVSLDGLIATDADGNHYKCGTPTRPSAWHGPGIEIWFATSEFTHTTPYCSKCGASYKVLVHDEYWPGCTCGAATVFNRVQVEVFQLEDVEYEDQYGFKRKEQRKSGVRMLTLIGIETHGGTLGAETRVFTAVDGQDRVYTKGVHAGAGWTTGTEFWMTQHHKKLAAPSFASIVMDTLIAGIKNPATGGVTRCGGVSTADAIQGMQSIFGRFNTGENLR